MRRELFLLYGLKETARLKKLTLYGNVRWDDWVVRWIWNWLKDKAQRVVIRGAESSRRPVASGVPQWCPESSPVQCIHQ